MFCFVSREGTYLGSACPSARPGRGGTVNVKRWDLPLSVFPAGKAILPLGANTLGAAQPAEPPGEIPCACTIEPLEDVPSLCPPEGGCAAQAMPAGPPPSEHGIDLGRKRPVHRGLLNAQMGCRDSPTTRLSKTFQRKQIPGAWRGSQGAAWKGSQGAAWRGSQGAGGGL